MGGKSAHTKKRKKEDEGRGGGLRRPRIKKPKIPKVNYGGCSRGDGKASEYKRSFDDRSAEDEGRNTIRLQTCHRTLSSFLLPIWGTQPEEGVKKKRVKASGSNEC